MIVTFPHLGSAATVLRLLLSYIDIPCVVPEANGERALLKGTELCSEEMCLPFKYMAGNLAEAYERGADTALMVATCGPCRLGEYGEILKIVLDNAGYTFDWILIDSPLSAFDGCSRRKLAGGALAALRLVGRIDGLRKKAAFSAGYVDEPAKIVRLLKETHEKLDNARTFREAFSVIRRAERELAYFPRNESADPLKILVVGEIYTSIESEASGRIVERLMMEGCCVKCHIDISWWIRHTLAYKVLPERITRYLVPEDSIRTNVGGYGRETAAKIMRDRWSDGIIKIMPAGCMPEIVTKAFCENLRLREKGFQSKPILHLIYDEMRGQAGYETRLEAFTDMLERRKNVLAGDRYRIHKHRSGADG